MTQEIQNQSSTNETFVSDDHHECQECSKNFKERNILEVMWEHFVLNLQHQHAKYVKNNSQMVKLQRGTMMKSTLVSTKENQPNETFFRKIFKTKSNMLNHEKPVHEGKSYPCQLWKQNFSTQLANSGKSWYSDFIFYHKWENWLIDGFLS